MMGFKRGAQAKGSDTQPSEGTKKKINPKDRMAQVVAESNQQSDIDLMRANTEFLLDNGTKAAVLVLNTRDERFGTDPKFAGFGPKAVGDSNSDKGQISQLIKSGQLSVMVSADMREAEVMAFIPDSQTMERMSEFTIMVDAPYSWGVVDLATYTTTEVGDASTEHFAVAQQVREGARSIADVIREAGVSTTSTAAGDDSPFGQASKGSTAAVVAPVEPATPVQEAVEVDEPGQEVEAPSADIIDEAEVGPAMDDEVQPEEYDDAPEYDDEAGYEYDEAPTDDDLPVPSSLRADESAADEAALAAGDEPEYDDSVIVDESQAQSTILRRFTVKDLDLVIDRGPLDTFFAARPQEVWFEEVSGDGELDRALADINARGNSELAMLRQTVAADREREYLDLVSRLIQSTLETVDTENPSTRYGAMFEELRRTRDEINAARDRLVSDERRKIEDRFNTEAERKAEAAAAHARDQYIERNSPRIRKEIEDVETLMIQRADDKYAVGQRQILDERAEEARLLIETGMTDILKILGERERAALSEERAIVERVRKEAQEFSSRHLSDEAARVEGLARIDESARALRQASEAHEKELAEVAQKNEAEQRRLVAELEQTRERSAADLQVLRERAEQDRADLEATLKSTTTELREARAEAANLASNLVNADTRASERVAREVDSARREGESRLADAENRLREARSRSNWIGIAACVIALLALLLGLLVGRMMTSSPATTTPAPVATVTQTVQAPAAEPTASATTPSITPTTVMVPAPTVTVTATR